jgi:hypothetical protein
MTIDRLEDLACLALDLAKSVGARGMTAARRDNFRFLLVASKRAQIKNRLRKMKAAQRKSHVALIGRLRGMVKPNAAETLNDLMQVSMDFLAYFDKLGRPLYPHEVRAWCDILKEFESRTVGEACDNRPPEKDHHDITAVMERLRAAFYPDPPVARPHQIGLERIEKNAGVAVAESHKGNFAPVMPPFKELGPKRLTAMDISAILAQIADSANGMAVMIGEVALTRDWDQTSAARIAKLAKLMGKLARKFIRDCREPIIIPQAKDADDARARSLAGEQVLYLRDAEVGQLFGKDAKRLRNLAKRLGMTRAGLDIKPQAPGTPDQHIELTGAILAKAKTVLEPIPDSRSDAEAVADQAMMNALLAE